MPTAKRASIGFLICILALPGCGGGSSMPNTPTNPSSTLVTVQNAATAPLPGVTVTLSTGLNGQTPTGVISTGVTGANGQVTFSLPATGTLCISASVASGNSSTFAGNCSSPPFPSTFGLSLNV
jgi:hypothetical protein